MYKKIVDILTEEGLDVYSIGQHKGACSEPFIVVKEYLSTSTTGKVIVSNTIDIFPFYPLGRYTQVSAYINKVDQAMLTIPGLERIYDGGPITIDDNKEAYTTRLSYRLLKRKRR